MGDWLLKYKGKFAPYFDRFDLLIFLILVVLLGVAGRLDILSVSLVVAIATAIGVFTAIYNRRHQEKVTPSVRESYFAAPESDSVDFGLQNFGPGPALYLQILVTDEHNETLFEVKPRERPLHLKEGDAVGFLCDGVAPCDEFKAIIEQPNRLGADDMIHIHFSYFSERGVREPHELNGVADTQDECIFDDLLELEGPPRRMEVSEIREQCL